MSTILGSHHAVSTNNNFFHTLQDLCIEYLTRTCQYRRAYRANNLFTAVLCTRSISSLGLLFLRHLTTFPFHEHVALCPDRLKNRVVLSSLLCHQMPSAIFGLDDSNSNTSDAPNIDFSQAQQIIMLLYWGHILCILCIPLLFVHRQDHTLGNRECTTSKWT